MKEKTAMQLAIDAINNLHSSSISNNYKKMFAELADMLEPLLAKERQDIVQSHHEGQMSIIDVIKEESVSFSTYIDKMGIDGDFEDSEQYFISKYTK